jgi:hypothetical protein
MPMAPTMVATGLAFDNTMVAYADIAPVTAGFLGLYIPNATTPCDILVGGLPVPAPDPIGHPTMYPGTSKTLAADMTFTLFTMGRIDPVGGVLVPPPGHIPTFIPVIDQPPAPPAM